ncbi:MAG TPA: hypothetical protein VK504_27695 [Vicinamibacterales bacterium]|nr:hypothetical protein [Vicinamibacterales bacterium]
MTHLLLSLFLALTPSRPPVKGCVWEQVSDKSLGFEAWVQRCDYGFRKIDFFIKGNSLFIRYSDGGAPDPAIDILDLRPGETAEAGLKRLFAAHTPKAVVKKCKLAPYVEDAPPAGVKRFTFVPRVPPKTSPDEVGDPPCGEWGEAPDGIQYFEVHPGSRKVLFVRVGQDEPLFDEQTLRLFEPGAGK